MSVNKVCDAEYRELGGVVPPSVPLLVLLAGSLVVFFCLGMFSVLVWPL